MGTLDASHIAKFGPRKIGRFWNLDGVGWISIRLDTELYKESTKPFPGDHTILELYLTNAEAFEKIEQTIQQANAAPKAEPLSTPLP